MNIRTFIQTAILGTALLLSPLVRADLVTSVVDFETGFVEQQEVLSVSAGGVDISLSCGLNPGEHSCYTFAYGGAATAYQRNDAIEAGMEGRVGTFGLTDEFDGPSTKYNYYFSFSAGLVSFGLDLLDYRGNKFIGESAILTLFSDANFTTAIGQDAFSPTYVPPDGNLETLSATPASELALSASLTFTAYSAGTGIDNLTFARNSLISTDGDDAEVPAPAAWALLLVALMLVRTRRA